MCKLFSHTPITPFKQTAREEKNTNDTQQQKEMGIFVSQKTAKLKKVELRKCQQYYGKMCTDRRYHLAFYLPFSVYTVCVCI